MNFLQNLKYTFYRPISFPIQLIMKMRRQLSDWGVSTTFDTPLPSIVVGNLSTGGTGKTPTTAWLIEALLKRNLSPLLITRGYRGKLESKKSFFKKEDLVSPSEVGDEPAMLKSRFTNKLGMFVGKDRVGVLQKFFRIGLGDVLIFDDGWQYLKLKKTMGILLFDATLPVSNLKVFPSGDLRESLEGANDASAFVLTKANLTSIEQVEELRQFLLRKFPHTPQFVAQYKLSTITNAKGKVLSKGEEVLAFCGLANNESFYQQLKLYGHTIGHYGDYPDHYRFPKSVVNSLVELAQKKNYQLVCTEKDWVKLQGRMTDDCYVAKMEVDFGNQTQELKNLIFKKLGRM
ncbi:MAG: tetraacyldisaccharide 4'-kinase [Bacteriovoracaceae bacterium]|nr:tetraacyldisaccharide 4'-kinase [Bacteriovoracaceae bacterium]